MDNIIKKIWWPMVIALLPLDGSIVMHYIYEENFCSSFWLMTAIYIFLSATVGARIYLIEKKGKK